LNPIWRVPRKTYPGVCDPYQQNDIHRLEMVQRRAARYVTNRYHNTSSVSSMIEQIEWTLLRKLMVLLALEQMVLICLPHLRSDEMVQNDIHRLEMVQRRAARYVTNRYHNTSSVSSMIEQLEWTTLQRECLKRSWIICG
jgi:uncharacterized protein (UPF0305 family)